MHGAHSSGSYNYNIYSFSDYPPYLIYLKPKQSSNLTSLGTNTTGLGKFNDKILDNGTTWPNTWVMGRRNESLAN